MQIDNDFSYFIDREEKFVSGKALKSLINSIVSDEKIVNAKKIAITLKEPVEFCAAFLAMISLNKEIILLPNYLESTITGFENEYDYLIEEIKIIKDAKDFGLSLNLKTQITLFTSGSLGVPKKIEKSFKELVSEVEVLEDVFGERLSSTIIYSTVSHQHIYGLLFRVLWPVLKRRTVASYNFEFPEELLKFNNKTKKALISSPAFLKRLEIDSKNLFVEIFSSGGKLTENVKNLCFQNFDIYPTEIYGSTETGGVGHRKNEAYFTPFPKVKVKIGLSGSLQVESPFIKEEVFQTNDLVELEESGHFKLLGRSDRLVKIEEKRVSLDEIELQLIKMKEIKEAYALTLKDDHREYIACVIVLNDKTHLESLTKLEKVKEIKKFLREFFEPVLIPKKYRFVTALPYNSQSKLDLKKMSELFYE